MEEEPGISTNGLLLRSFLLVAGAYVVNLVGICVAATVLAATVFPKTMLVFDEPDKFKAAFEADPSAIFPPELMWILLAVSVVLSFVLGYLVARLAPIGKFPHALLFAMIMFVQFLQLAIGNTTSLQTILILFMALSPIAALLGANMYLKSEEPQLE